MKKIEKIIAALSEGVAEKDEVIAVTLLAALAGQNTFLLGPPGTAKSLISRRLASVFSTERYFEYLMQRFSTPEEVFGPISLSELKKDNYVRKTEGYLPEADFAFLDEIWKSSPAVLNTLLTIINEKKFRNGTEVTDVPLKTLISASNETPPEGQGLEALYDRFLVRLVVSPLESVESFEEVLQSQPADSRAEIADEDKITNKELAEWQADIKEMVTLSDETLSVIRAIKVEIEKFNAAAKAGKKRLKIYVSDRRWQRAAGLLRAAAYFCGRTETNLVDTLLLRHCLWSNDTDREILMAVVEDSVQKNGLKTSIDFSDSERQKDVLDKDIDDHLYYSQNKYKTVSINGNDYYKERITLGHTHYRSEIHEVDLYIPAEHSCSDGERQPVDKNGNAIEGIFYDFKGNHSYHIRCDDGYIYDKKGNEYVESIQRSPKISVHKGDVKKGVHSHTFSGLKSDVTSIKKDVSAAREEIEEKKSELEGQLASYFVAPELGRIAIESVDEQLNRIAVVEADCDHLMIKVEKAEEEQA